MIDKEQTSPKTTHNTNSKAYQFQKSFPVVSNKEIQSAEKQDQSYALMKYRELVAARKKQKILYTREPEIYHHDLYQK